jgi:hypothetical protein
MPQLWSLRIGPKRILSLEDGVPAEAYHLVLGDAKFTSPPILANRFGVAPQVLSDHKSPYAM